MQKSGFHGLNLDGKQVLGIGSLKQRNWGGNSLQGRRRRLQITARSAKTSNNIEVEVDKPLGLALGQKSGGGVVITVSISFFLLASDSCFRTTYLKRKKIGHVFKMFL